jgi:hypothetical protein
MDVLADCASEAGNVLSNNGKWSAFRLELRTGLAARGPGRAGPENSNFPDGPARAELPNLGPARPGSFPVGRVVCRSLCLVLPFPLSSYENFRNVSRNIDNTIKT